MEKQKYSVRRPGCASWTDCGTIREARKEQDIANRTVARGHIIVNNHTGEQVT